MVQVLQEEPCTIEMYFLLPSSGVGRKVLFIEN